MKDDGVVIEYDTRPEGDGWTVFNIATGEPALWKVVRQVELPFADADDLVDLFNAMERASPGSSVTGADGSR
ncbi:hypothetical protein ASF24_04425 [Methylobacterium sp. Leaf86]|uniref:hypothetical protein n=1 Tax=Methylobacterium sp. Leaf86 TaxID=1736242 RepID=UPI0006F1CF71|nr:hypothetical protein [Methylobacterium sp. Leaf86]KQO53589.1 hypothetical protein ASF24_04425 [Methylobacterium sp. Leaf86]